MANVTVNIGDPLIIVLKVKKNQVGIPLDDWSVAYKLMSPANVDTQSVITHDIEADTVTMSMDDTSELDTGFNTLHLKLTSPTGVVLRYKINVKVTRAVI
jgi:hypothetical protein